MDGGDDYGESLRTSVPPASHALDVRLLRLRVLALFGQSGHAVADLQGIVSSHGRRMYVGKMQAYIFDLR